MKKIVVKIVLLLIPVIYLAGILFIPWMQPLRYNVFTWIVFFIYIVNLIFIYSLMGKKDKNIHVTEQEKEDMKLSQELLKDRGKWFT